MEKIKPNLINVGPRADNFYCQVFFWTLVRELLKSTMDSLAESKQMSSANRHNLGKDGDGILASMPYHRAMLEDLMKLPNYPLINA